MRLTCKLLFAVCITIIFSSATFLVSPAVADEIVVCVQKNDGQMRLVASKDDCRPPENSVSWNVQGPPGQDGTDGEDGAPGLPGQDGAQGPAGIGLYDCPYEDDINAFLTATPLTVASNVYFDCRIRSNLGFLNIYLGGSPDRSGSVLLKNTSTTILDDAVTSIQAEACADLVPLCTEFGLDFEAFYSVGDTGPAGGIVFYVNEDGISGLEAARADQITARWGVVSGCANTLIGTGTAIGTGALNTAAIIAVCGPDSAARSAVSVGDGWFLPSNDELYELYLNQGVVGGFANDYYWSSSEAGRSGASIRNFGNGIGGATPKVSFFRVRAVRAF